MREWIKMFEDQEADRIAAQDAENDAHSADLYSRESRVEGLIRELCAHDASIELADGSRAVIYDEELNRTARIRTAGPVTLNQLTILARIGDDMMIDESPYGSGIEITMIVKADLG